MSVLDLVPEAWLSSDINVFNDNRVLVAELHFSRWRENGSILFEGRRYAVHKDGMFNSRFLLEADGRNCAQAQLKASWSRTVFLDDEGVSYVLRWTALSRRVQVSCKGLELGAVYRTGFWGRRARGELVDEIPLRARVFMLWLICLGWNRDAAG
jgi:hypothetical protein